MTPKTLILGLIASQLVGLVAIAPQTVSAQEVCSTSYGRVLKNGLGGGVAGGAVGALVKSENRSKGAVQGAVIGAAGGAGYGYYKEYRRKKNYNCDARANATYNSGTSQDPYYAPQQKSSGGLLGRIF
jgi:hypothetical protein